MDLVKDLLTGGLQWGIGQFTLVYWMVRYEL